MTTLAITLPNIGDPNATTDPLIRSGFASIVTWANGNVDSTNLTAATNTLLGISDVTNVRSGSSIIATTENTNSAAFTTLTTPDRVSNIVLPSAGLVQIFYQATWQESVQGAAQAAIFIGANQLKLASPGVAAPAVQSAAINVAAMVAKDTILTTTAAGLLSQQAFGTATTAYTGDVTTGQILGGALSLANGLASAQTGGPVYVFAAAGTYTISVQYLTSSGTVTAKNRRLYVRAIGF